MIIRRVTTRGEEFRRIRVPLELAENEEEQIGEALNDANLFHAVKGTEILGLMAYD